MPRKGHCAIPVHGLLISAYISYSLNGNGVQRLFSNFADGWPGVGLLLLRLVTGAALIHFGIGGMREGAPWAMIVLPIICIAPGIALLVGLFTPIAGAVAAIAKLGIAISRFASHSGDPWIVVGLAILAAALAMIGPGAWSIDARRFGRKHISLRDR
jgi:putative oxidoreductase